MKKTSLAVLVSLSALTGVAYAQTDTGIRMSTDPQVAEGIEQHAQSIQSQQEAAPAPAEHMMPHHPHGHHKKAEKE